MPIRGKLYRALEVLSVQEVPEYGHYFVDFPKDASPWRTLRPNTIALYLGGENQKHWFLWAEKIYMYQGIVAIHPDEDFENLWELVE